MFAFKLFLNVPIKTPVTVYGELGHYPLYVLFMIRCVEYWFRLLRQPDRFCSRKTDPTQEGRNGMGIAYQITFMPGWIWPCVVA